MQFEAPTLRRIVPILLSSALAAAAPMSASLANAAPDLRATASVPQFLLPATCPAYYTQFPDLDGVCNSDLLRNLTELKPGQRVAVIQLEQLYVPDGIGYFAHALAQLVGPRGHVYVITTPVTDGSRGSTTIKGRVVTGDFADSNVTRVQVPIPITGIPVSQKLNLVWAAHGVYSFFDLLQPFEAPALKPPFSAPMFKPIFDALEPGGRFIIMDADVEYGCFDRTHNCLNFKPRLLNSITHREMEALIEQAGFKLDLETSNFLDPTYKGVLHPPRWGSDSESYAVGYPFLWKYHRLTGTSPSGRSRDAARRP